MLFLYNEKRFCPLRERIRMKMSRNDGHKDQFRRKIIHNYDVLATQIAAHRTLGRVITCTLGSFDWIHEGHMRYLVRAWEASNGGILVVGVDSDRTMRRYKDPTRPMVKQSVRLELLTYLEFVHYVTVVDDVDTEGNWQYGLVNAIRPDIFIASRGSYTEEQLHSLKGFAKRVIVLPRQAATSSSTLIRQTVVKYLNAALSQQRRTA
jgi:cytidyltransferase-like protein